MAIQTAWERAIAQFQSELDCAEETRGIYQAQDGRRNIATYWGGQVDAWRLAISQLRLMADPSGPLIGDEVHEHARLARAADAAAAMVEEGASPFTQTAVNAVESVAEAIRLARPEAQEKARSQAKAAADAEEPRERGPRTWFAFGHVNGLNQAIDIANEVANLLRTQGAENVLPAPDLDGPDDDGTEGGGEGAEVPDGPDSWRALGLSRDDDPSGPAPTSTDAQDAARLRWVQDAWDTLTAREHAASEPGHVASPTEAGAHLALAIAAWRTAAAGGPSLEQTALLAAMAENRAFHDVLAACQARIPRQHGGDSAYQRARGTYLMNEMRNEWEHRCLDVADSKYDMAARWEREFFQSLDAFCEVITEPSERAAAR